VTRILGYIFAGLFVWPLFIPAVVDGCGSEKANEKLDYDYNAKLSHECTVKPYSLVNGLIIVPNEEFEGSCTLRVVDANTNESFILNSNSSSILFDKN
jgi:hypothetical protein